MSNCIELEEGWSKIQPNIDRLVQQLWPSKGVHHASPIDDPEISSKGYMSTFIQVYNMCTQKPPHNYSDQLYERYKQTVEQIFKENVIPRLDGDPDTDLSAVVKDQLYRFRIFVRCMSALFSYLDRFHVKRQGLPSLKDSQLYEQQILLKIGSE